MLLSQNEQFWLFLALNSRTIMEGTHVRTLVEIRKNLYYFPVGVSVKS